jgi:hypothetical protein
LIGIREWVAFWWGGGGTERAAARVSLFFLYLRVWHRRTFIVNIAARACVAASSHLKGAVQKDNIAGAIDQDHVSTRFDKGQADNPNIVQAATSITIIVPYAKVMMSPLELHVTANDPTIVIPVTMIAALQSQVGPQIDHGQRTIIIVKVVGQDRSVVVQIVVVERTNIKVRVGTQNVRARHGVIIRRYQLLNGLNVGQGTVAFLC